jgi:sulfate transport system permease protein
MSSVNRKVLPGFSLTLGYSMFYLSALVLIPIAACFIRGASIGWTEFVDTVWSERARSAYVVTFGASFVAALINVFFGLLIAWVLVRYKFPGKRVFDSLIDVPLALPTSVAGLVYSTLYVETGWLGQYLVPMESSWCTRGWASSLF